MKRTTVMKYRVLFVFFLFLLAKSNGYSFTQPSVSSGTSVSAPTGEEYVKNHLSELIPKSPEVASLGKFDVLPINLYTGLPEISIPLFELKTPSLTIPITLQYNYNGCKPNELSSWIGLGWSLTGGGMISCTVMGNLDSANGVDNITTLGNPLSSNYTFINNVVNGSYNFEPDIYSYSFGKYSGKFIIKDNIPHLLTSNNPNVKIVNSGGSFVIIDENGNKYIFSTNKEQTNCPTNTGSIPYSSYTSAWYLTQIISSNQQDVINFSYTSYTYSPPKPLVDSYSFSSATLINSNYNYKLGVTEGPSSIITSLILTGISSKYGSVYFYSNTDRQDITYSTDAQRLYKAELSCGNNKRTVNFNQSYFSNNSRLRLDNIQFFEDGSKYQFQYEDGSFPDYKSRSIDLFGYSNGYGNVSLFPKQCFPSSNPTEYGTRTSNINASKVGIINKIIYPTGGSSVFEWEQNKIGHSFPSSRKDSVMSICQYDAGSATNGISFTDTYFTLSQKQRINIAYIPYTDELVDNFPILLIYNATGTNILYSTPLTNPTYRDTITLAQGSYVMRMQCSNLSHRVSGKINFVNYFTDVTDVSDGPGLRIQRIKMFDRSNNTTPVTTDLYTYNDGIIHMSDAIGYSNLITRTLDGDITSTSLFASTRSAYSGYSDQRFFYPKVVKTTLNETLSGKTEYNYEVSPAWNYINLVSDISYRFDGVQLAKIKEHNYQYQYTGGKSWGFYKTKKAMVLSTTAGSVSTIGNIAQCLPNPDPTNMTDCLTEIYTSEGSYTISSEFNTKLSDKEKLYNSDMSFIETETTYFYDNPNHYNPTRIVRKNSLNEELITEYKYPLDYNYSGLSTLSQINTINNTNLLSISNNYLASQTSLINALTPYQPYTAHKTEFAALVNSYNCFNNYVSAMNTANSQYKTNVQNYYTALHNSAINTQDPGTKGVLWMQDQNIGAPYVEKIVSLKKLNGQEYLLFATKKTFNVKNDLSVVNTQLDEAEFNGTLLKSTFISNPSAYYQPKFFFEYNNSLQLTSQYGNDNVKHSYIWGYNGLYPVAEVIGADYNTILPLVNMNVITNLNYDYTEQDINVETQKIRNALSGTTCQVNTFTYKPLYGMGSNKDSRGVGSFYEYDRLGRLIKTSDNQQQKVAEYMYNYGTTAQ